MIFNENDRIYLNFSQKTTIFAKNNNQKQDA